MAAGPIDRYLDELRDHLPYPMPRFISETRDHLIDSAAHFAREGVDAEEAERVAIETYGDPRTVVEAVVREGGPRMSPRTTKTLLFIAALLVMPAIVFVVSSLLEYQSDYNAIYDGFFGTVFDRPDAWEIPLNLAIVAGPVVALMLVAIASVRLGISRDDGRVTATVVIDLGRWTIAIACAGALVLAAMTAYLLLENLPCLVGGRVTC